MLGPNAPFPALLIYHPSKSAAQILLFLLPSYIIFQEMAGQSVPNQCPLSPAHKHCLKVQVHVVTEQDTHVLVHWDATAGV